MKRILFVIPHLSTGGLPQVVVNKVELLKSDFEVKCIEYDFLGDAYVVQKNRLIDLVGKENLITFFENKNQIFDIIEEFKPDIISMEEFPEYFMSDDIAEKIYTNDRKYKIIETTHDSSFSVSSKKWFPDKFIFVSAFNAFRYSVFDIPYEIIEYPIDKKIPNKDWALKELGLDPSYKHVVCVGLFTQRKNQGYLFDIARKLEDKKILFHFIGNQADNFYDYWKPLMDNKPKNCIVWGERKDVDTFLQACDVFFFPSKGDRNNKELNPIAIKEALVYNMPMMLFNLDVYCGKYNKEPNITFLTGDEETDRNNLIYVLSKIPENDINQIQKQSTIKILKPASDNLKKVFIIDFFVKSEDKKNLLRRCIESIKKFGYDIILVGHCSIPEDIINSVNYFIYDSDNQFNNNHVYSWKIFNDIEIRKNIYNSHEFPIVRSMRSSFNLAKSMGYDFFHFTEFDHVYSENGIKEILRLENEIISQGKDYLFFRPIHAVFSDVVGTYFESCFFSGFVNKFIEDFENYFPKNLDEYNKKFAPRLPNCLEYFFYELFNNKNCIVIEDYVKSYFKDSLINISSYQDTTTDILLNEEEIPYLVISNNNHLESKYKIYFNDILNQEFEMTYDTKLIEIPFSCNIKVDRYNKNILDETTNLEYNSLKKDEYKTNGIIINLNKKTKMFTINFESEENKINFIYNLDQPKNIGISIKDIDSHACIYYMENYWMKNSGSWAIPLPKHVIDFQNNPNFGGFLFEYFENDQLIGQDKLRIKEIQFTKPVYDFSNKEPIFMNYMEFFEEKIYDQFDIHNLGLVFDIGASVGLWSQYILSRGAKKVYSFEPNKNALQHINKNLGNNERVKIIPYGVYTERTKIPFYIDENNSLISSTLKENGTSQNPSYYIETVTLEEIISQNNIEKIDLLKMDIEGAEFAIFEKMSNETLSKIDSVLIEYHDFYFNDGSSKIDKLIFKLENAGFHITRPNNYKFIFGYKIKKNYWIDVNNNIEIRNLYDFSKNFSWDNMNKGIQNGYHHMYHEMHFMFDEYTSGCVYERYGCQIQKGDVIVDIGANIGGFSNLAFEKGASKIYSFEPSDLSFSCLTRNKPENCEIFKLAISDHMGFDFISSPTKNNTMCASLIIDGEETNICSTITLDYLFEKKILDKIDFLKIDTEGSESKIINGISDENLLKIDRISMEVHANMLSSLEIDNMLNRLNNSGFKSFTLFLGSDELRIYTLWR